MAASAIAQPKVVSRDEWLVARKELLAKEKELTSARDVLSAKRRELPWVKVETRRRKIRQRWSLHRIPLP